MKNFIKKLLLVFLAVSLILPLVACGPKEEGEAKGGELEEVDTISLKGVYEGVAEGYSADLHISVEMDDEGKFIAVNVAENEETEDIGTVAIDKIPQSIIESQSLDIDAVSGATVTGDAIIEAVARALEKAGLNPEDYGYIAPTVARPSVEIDYEIDRATMPEKKEITDSVTLRDAKDREVVLDLPISSYAISTMDVIDYIIPLKGEDAFHMLVGSGQDGGHGFNKYAELYVPKVGNYMKHTGQISDHNAPFDLEVILSMEPDVLIINSAMGAHRYAMEVEDTLLEAGIKIVLVDVPGKNLERSVQDTMGILGKIFQEEEKADELIKFIDEQYQIISSKNLKERQDKPTVYYEKSGYSDVFGSTSTSKGGWGLVVDIAGGDNIADPILLETAASKGSGSTIDPELVLAANPDYIILSGINDGWLDILNETKDIKFDIVNRNGWKDLDAIKDNNLYEFAHSTSRSIFAFYPSLKMAKIFYPEEFADLDPEEKLDEFFDRFMLLDRNISTWSNTLGDAK